MAHFFPAASRLDVERPSSLRRIPTRNVLRETGDETQADGRQGRPSHINWLQSSLAASQAGLPMPKRPPSVRLGRSASLSAIPAPSPLHRQSSTISNHSLQLDRLASSRTDGPSAQPQAKPMPLSPISEQSYIPTPTSRRDLFPTDVEPGTPVSVASTYSAFLRRPLKRSISATSTSSLHTNVTSIHPPTLPPLNITPLEIRPVYPPVSHRAGPQLFSTVYEDTASERTGSFVTARSLAGDTEDPVSPASGRAAVDVRGPSGSTTLYSSAALPGGGGGMDPFTDSDRGSTPFTTTPPSGSGTDSSSSDAPAPTTHARPRPRTRGPTSGGSGSGTSDTFVLRRLTFGSALSRPSFTAARRALARLPPLPVLLFWAGFVAPWCWLIGGWLIAEGRWEENGKARAALPLWRPRRRQRTKGKGKGKTAVPLLGKDLEKGPGDGAQEEQQQQQQATGADAAPHRHWAWAWWIPFAPRASALVETHGAPPSGDGDAVQKEKVVTFVKPYSAEVWVYRSP
ncbi:hypothetical protein EDB89DRAFT_1908627 [Lactarius sanguifluus]|nr:hypothetical protein EDB89DRAFT_1908627 [Lactarius sanguifluus]